MKKERIWASVNSEVVDILKSEAKRRGASIGDIIEAALKSFFMPDDRKKREKVLNGRLNRIQGQVGKLDVDVALLTEALSVFVRAWLTHTPEIPEGQRQAVEAAGGPRYQKYLDIVAASVTNGQTMNAKIKERADL